MFAGVVNTGVTCGSANSFQTLHLILLKNLACWALLYLGAQPTWKKRAIDEYTALVLKHADTLSTEPLHKRLATIPLDAWESELPSVELIIRETIRLTVSFTAFRRNVAKELKVDDVVIKRRDFLLYSLGRTHMDPEIYTEPTKFDPDRYLEGREEDRKQNYGYVGWGAGNYPSALRRGPILILESRAPRLCWGKDGEAPNETCPCAYASRIRVRACGWFRKISRILPST